MELSFSFHLAPACGPTPEVKSGAIHQINNGKSIVYRGEEAPYRHLIISANRLGFRRVIFFSAILMLIHLFSEFKNRCIICRIGIFLSNWFKCLRTHVVNN